MKPDFDLDRRKFLVTVGRAGLAVAGGLIVPLPRGVKAQTQAPPQDADYTIRIAPVSHEIASGKVIKTTAYNGSIPGPALRLKEGKPVRINVINDSGYPNLIHWHGLYLPSEQDGSSEEGSPIIAPGQSLTYAYTPKPSGTRWYHSHFMEIRAFARHDGSSRFVIRRLFSSCYSR